MDSSTNESLIMGAYVFIFIGALSASLYLFHSIYDYSELAYQYGKNIEKGNLITGIPDDKKIILKGTDVISYIYDYFVYDTYSNPAYTDRRYNIKILNSDTDTQSILKDSDINQNYNYFTSKIDLSAKYELKVISIDKENGKAEIDIIKQR